MAEYERTVLDHYRISEPFPTAWPAGKDESDASDDEEEAIAAKEAQAAKMKASRRKSKYSALETMGSRRRSYVPGAQHLDGGIESLVRRDEPDPLGSGDSVVRILRQQGLPVQDDINLSKSGSCMRKARSNVLYQETISSYPPRLSHHQSSYRKSIATTPPNSFSKDSMSSPDLSTRSPHL